jgi:hypothetical protein
MYPTTQLSPPSVRPIHGKYLVEREIGRGGMGIVYRAMHIGLERPVALKVVLPELAHNEMVVQRMLDEARCAAQITSVHVVRVLDVGQLDSGEPFIVMDLVEGEDVARAVERDGIPPLELAVQWVLEASVAIAEAHEKRIVHRDLKPANLFLARSEGAAPLIKVLDFGISKRLDRAAHRSVTQPNQLIGSPHYMAPEQIRAPLAVDARADIWALGVILIELVTGRRPFGGDTLGSVCANVLGSEPDLPEEALAALPAELLLVLRRAVRKDPNERFQDVAELAAALAPFAPTGAEGALSAIARRSRWGAQRTSATSGCSVALPSLAAPPVARSRRASVAFGLGGVALALALASNVWLIARNPRSTPMPEATFGVAPLMTSRDAAPPAPALDAAPTAVEPAPPSSRTAEPAPLPPRVDEERFSAPVTVAVVMEATPAGAARPEHVQPSSMRGSAPATAVADHRPPLGAESHAPAARSSGAPAPTTKASAWNLETFGGRR